VEIFYLHAADRKVPFEKTLEECHKMFKEGKFVKLGLSNFTAYEIAEVVMICRQHGWVRPSIYQGMYNAISMPQVHCLASSPRKYTDMNTSSQH